MSEDGSTYIELSYGAYVFGYWERDVDYYGREGVFFEPDEGGIDEADLKKSLPKHLMDAYAIDVDSAYFSTEDPERGDRSAWQTLDIAIDLKSEDFEDGVMLDKLVKDLRPCLAAA